MITLLVNLLYIAMLQVAYCTDAGTVHVILSHLKGHFQNSQLTSLWPTAQRYKHC